MELSIPIDFINPENVYFVEKKKNIIVEGDFVKVVYSTESFEMNGVYIAMELNFCTFPKIGSTFQKGVTPRLWTDFFPTTGLECAAKLIRDFPEQSDKSWIQIIHKTSNGISRGERRGDDDESGMSRNIKRIVTFDPSSKENVLLIEKLCKFERDVVERYIAENCPSKTATYILRNQLMTNSIKYHSENKYLDRKLNNMERFILKISGVWETSTNIGITMKFILMC